MYIFCIFRDTFLNFHKYLQDQLHQQKKKVESTVNVSKKSGKTTKSSSSDKASKKSSKAKDPLDMGILFPKKRKPKEKLGLNVSENPRYI